jgi:hypothetical protein
MRIGLDSSSVMAPSRSAPAAMHTPPASRLMVDARAIAVAGSPAASGTTTAAMTGASDESGPRTSRRFGPTAA